MEVQPEASCEDCWKHLFAWQPLQYSCLENPMDRGASQATWGRKESDMTEATLAQAQGY